MDNTRHMDTARELVFPATWRKESCDRFQQLADMGRITQADIDEIESVLVWFRNVRDEFAQKDVTTK